MNNNKTFLITLKIGTIFFAIYAIIFSTLVVLGEEENITISDTNGKFQFNVKTWAPYGYISEEKRTIVSLIFLPMYDCWPPIEKQLNEAHKKRIEKAQEEARKKKH